VTEWKTYRDLDWAGLKNSMKTPLVVDGRSFLDRADLEAAGYRLVTIP
jgi:UDP-glucose 6-dehydrogenase